MTFMPPPVRALRCRGDTCVARLMGAGRRGRHKCRPYKRARSWLRLLCGGFLISAADEGAEDHHALDLPHDLSREQAADEQREERDRLGAAIDAQLRGRVVAMEADHVPRVIAEQEEIPEHGGGGGGV